jgi:hypothetical protein
MAETTDAPAFDTPDFSQLEVRSVDKPTARDMIVANHYSHKWQTTFGLENFGVFLDDELLGVAVYGHAMNSAAWGSITTIPREQCIELNRLWIDDRLGANTETWLMGRTFRLLRELGYRLVQSFADGRLGVGTIYQAANFTYHGFHETLFHADRDGNTHHDTSFSNTASATGMTSRNLMHARGELESFRVRTYRYLYPLDKRARREILLPAQPYPKERTGMIPVDGYTPPPGQIARSVALAEGLGWTDEAAELDAYLRTITDDADTHLAKQRQNRWVVALREKNQETA